MSDADKPDTDPSPDTGPDKPKKKLAERTHWTKLKPGEMLPPDQWERVGESKVAKDEAERKAYFQPFSYKDHNGRWRHVCGAATRKCANCRYRYKSASDKDMLSCPHCGMDRRCRKQAKLDRGRCRTHGGNTPRGANHGQWKGGKARQLLWGRSLPDGPRQAFQRALREMDSRNVYTEMATFQARIEQLSKRIAKSQDSDAWWVKLGQLEKAARDAASRQDQQAMDAALQDMMRLARRGASEASQWRELLEHVKDLAKLKQVQGQIEKDHKVYLSMTEAMAIITTMAGAVKEALMLVRDKYRTLQGVVESSGETIDASALPLQEVADSFVTADNLVQDRLQGMLRN